MSPHESFAFNGSPALKYYGVKINVDQQLSLKNQYLFLTTAKIFF